MAEPLIAVSGARSSWLTHAEEVRPQPLPLLQRRQVLQCDDHRYDLAAVGANGVVLASAVTLRPSGTEITTSSARIVRALPSTARRAQALGESPRLAVDRHRAPAAGIEHQDADRRGLDQRFGGSGRPANLFARSDLCHLHEQRAEAEGCAIDERLQGQDRDVVLVARSGSNRHVWVIRRSLSEVINGRLLPRV